MVKLKQLILQNDKQQEVTLKFQPWYPNSYIENNKQLSSLYDKTILDPYWEQQKKLGASGNGYGSVYVPKSNVAKMKLVIKKYAELRKKFRDDHKKPEPNKRDTWSRTMKQSAQVDPKEKHFNPGRWRD